MAMKSFRVIIGIEWWLAYVLVNFVAINLLSIHTVSNLIKLPSWGH